MTDVKDMFKRKNNYFQLSLTLFTAQDSVAAAINAFHCSYNNNNIGYRTFIKIPAHIQPTGQSSKPILLAVPLLRHMLATHVDSHDLVITCTCSSALQSVASAFFPKLSQGRLQHTGGRTPTTPSTQNKNSAH